MNSSSCGYFCIAWMLYIDSRKNKESAFAEFLSLLRPRPYMLGKPISLACRLRALFGTIWERIRTRYCSVVHISQFFVMDRKMTEHGRVSGTMVCRVGVF